MSDYTENITITPIKKAIDGFLLSCKVEGRSYGTIDCYADKLKGFLWYATNYNWPDEISAITTQHLREFLAYLRETAHRFNSKCPRAMKPCNSTTIQKYYRALSAMYNWLINEGIVDISPLIKIRVPKAEKKVIKALSSAEVNQLISSLPNTFDGIRNKAIILILVDCGLRLGELLNLKMVDINIEQQLMKVDGKTGERIVRYGKTTWQALNRYLKVRAKVNGHNDSLWLTEKGISLKDSSVETMFIKLRNKTGIHVHPHLLRHTFATMWLKNGGEGLMLQRLLGHTTLMMTNRYCQAVGCYDAIEAHRKFSPGDNLKCPIQDSNH
ncbi:MAG: tyrosine-type recombinase/integrase [Candidatus Hodarchaeales archaeon]